MTDGQSAAEGGPVRRHARPSGPAKSRNVSPTCSADDPTASYRAPGDPPISYSPPGRHAGQDGSADGPDPPQGSYQGMRRSPDSTDPNDTPRPGRSGRPKHPSAVATCGG